MTFLNKEDIVVFPMSFAQQRIWMSHQLLHGSVYNLPRAFNLKGNLNREIFEKCIQSIVDRHEILRTTYSVIDDSLSQIIHQELKIKIKDIDLCGFSVKEKKLKIQEYFHHESSYIFNLSILPLFNITLLRITNNEYVFLSNMHHIITDGWSMEIFIKELVFLYESEINNEESSGLKDLPIQYADYSEWQKERMEKVFHQSHLNYWLNKLQAIPDQLSLPFDHARPLKQNFDGDVVDQYLDKSIVSSLKGISQKLGTTVFMNLQASFAILLGKYCNHNDILVGFPSSGRNKKELEPLIGFFVNTLVLRTSLSGDPTYIELLEKVKESILEAFEHQDIPFEKIVENLNHGRALSMFPVFQVMMAFQNVPQKKFSIPGIELSVLDIHNKKSLYDISLHIYEVEKGLKIRWEFSTELFERATIEHMAENFAQLLKSIINDPQQRISELEHLSEKEKQKLLHEFNNTATEYPGEKTIVELFEAQVSSTPDNVAVVFEGKKLTYRELNEKANQLAHFLKEECTLKKNDLIGIWMHRSEWTVISLLGILKSGSAYVPIDPAYPKERLNYIVKDSNVSLIIKDTDENLIDGVKEINIVKEISSTGNTYNLHFKKVSHLAYIIYTSGSTGVPKGVFISHRNVTNFLLWAKSFYSKEELQGVLASTSICFDLSVFEIFVPLITGGKAVIVNDILSINSIKGKEKITLINTVPTAINELIKYDYIPDTVKVINLAGEPLKRKIVNELYEKGHIEKVYNLYAPSETTTYSTCSLLTKNDKGEPTIGKPISNTFIYVLDTNKNLLPVGVIGEIYIGGSGVANGYINKEEFTSQRFIDNPFRIGEKIYKTGDLGRWLPSGEIEFIGRNDYQVKIRGYRIELGEIENTILKSSGVKEVIVVAREENKDGDKYLVAYVVLEGEQNTEKLKDYLHQQLPTYMVPSFIVSMERLPLNLNGKVDRKALPAPEGEGRDENYVAPSGEIEEKLVKIWEEVLGKEKVGVKDNFFELGGHSLKALQLLVRIKKEFSVQIELNEIFYNKTIHSQVFLISNASKISYTGISKIKTQPSYSMSHGQKRLWLMSQKHESSLAYNIPGAIILEGSLDRAILEQSLKTLMERHESLRTEFRETNEGEVRQYILSSDSFTILNSYQDISKEENQEFKLQSIHKEEQLKSFDLGREPLWRTKLIKLSTEKHVLFYTMHHIISDGWSMQVLAHELVKVYTSLKENKKVSLQPLRIQYKDYSNWHEKLLLEESIKADEAYWLNQFQGDIAKLDLPSLQKRPLVKTYPGYRIEKKFPEATLQKLKKLCSVEGASLFMGLFSGLKALIYRYTGEEDIIVGSPIAGRIHRELEEQIGLYINTLALRTRVRGEDSFKDLLFKVKEVLLGAYSHQAYPFDMLVEKLNLVSDPSRSSLFDVMIVLQNQNTLSLSEKSEEGNIALRINKFKGLVLHNSQFDITFSFEEEDDSLGLCITYNTNIFNREIIERMFEHYFELITLAVDHPEESICHLNYIKEEEKQKLLIEFNNTATKYPEEKTIVELFEAQVSSTPDNVALVFKDKKLTYKELNEKANQLAHFLLELKTYKKEELIGLELHRSEWLIISQIAILKIGAAYVPIDLSNPKERKEFIKKDTECELIINNEFIKSFIVKEESCSINNIELPIERSSRDLAYVMYTSGSTGDPKGVLIEQRGVVRLVKGVNYVTLNEKSNLLSTGAIGFDAVSFEYWGMLLNGGRLLLCDQDQLLDIKILSKTIKDEQINTMWFTSSWFNQIVNSRIEIFETLKFIIVGGEKLSEYHVEKLRKKYPNINIINGYGPTENTTFSLTQLIEKEYETIPIGSPINNSTAYILDDNHKLLPIGVKGELYVGGAGISRGYHNREILTKEKFIAHPFKAGERLYKTGDICKRRFDGSIEFIGRNDYQVKIRGYRIEPGEIENTILKSPGVKEAVVVAREDNKDGDKYLVAYVVLEGEQNTEKLKDYLHQQLPTYMVPSFIISMERLPLNLNGKVDRKALPAPEGEGRDENYVAPSNEIEKALVEIWKEVFKLDNIGVEDNFFDLGGNSINSFILKKRIEERFGVHLTIKDIFDCPSIRSLLKGRSISLKPNILASQVLTKEKVYNASPIQVSLYKVIKEYSTSYLSNIVTVFKIHEDLNVDAFEFSLTKVLEKHDLLRGSFIEKDNKIIISISEEIKITLREIILEDKKQLEYTLHKLSLEEFDLNKGPFLKAVIIKTKVGGTFVFISTHHIVSDGTSMEIIYKDLIYYYKNFESGLSILEENKVGFNDYLSWINNKDTKLLFEKQKGFWVNKLNGLIPRIKMPLDFQKLNRIDFNGDVSTITVNGKEYADLKIVCKENNISLNIYILTLTAIILSRWSKQEEFLIGIQVDGRPKVEFKEVVGYFVNIILQKITIKGNDDFMNILNSIKHDFLEGLENQEILINDVWPSLNIETISNSHPFLDVLFVYHNYEKANLKEFTHLGIEKIHVPLKYCKIDLVFNILEINSSLCISINYKTSLFKQASIENLLIQLKELLSEKNSLLLDTYKTF